MTPSIETAADLDIVVSRLVIGARGSALAQSQANAVRNALGDSFPAMAVELHAIRTEGDIDKTSSLMQIGGRGVFASALQEALVKGAIDIAVHSAKDVPTIEPAGLVLAAFPQRVDGRDAVVSRHGVGLAELPVSPVIGTSSRRRAVQVLLIRPDATIVDVRGNIDTRLRKAETAAYDAVILAAAGLLRMGWEDRITEYLPFERFVPSPGQGALALETRADPDPAFAIARSLDRPEVSLAVRLEREFLRAMGGGCTTPVGSYAEIIGDTVRFWAMMGSDDGARLSQRCDEFPVSSALASVRELAARTAIEVSPAWSGIDLVPGPDSPGPLLGKRVLVTGTRDLVERLEAALGVEGAIVMSAPTIEILPSSKPDALETSLEQAASGAVDWMIVTSKNTAPALIQFGADRLNGSVKIAAVGTPTAKTLEEFGLVVNLVPRVQTGEGLVQAFNKVDLRGVNVLCLLGNLASDVVETGFRARGASVRRVESYESRESDVIPAGTREAVRTGRVDLAVFSSPSSVTTVTRLLGVDLAALSGACLVAIGSTTSRAMDGAGLPVHVVADEPSVEGVVAACRTYYAERAGLGA
jgi:hydroxymethylbilane synthase